MWIVAGLLGLVSVLSGALPWHDAVDLLDRVWPILLFLVAVTVLAELADAAQVFDVAASRAARWGRGSTTGLFLLVCLLGAVTTILLSLDTTAVLLTPVVLATAQQLKLPTLPFALAAVWLANTASLLLPVSNLTNLLAINRLSMSTVEYASHMWLPALAAVLVTIAFLFLISRRQLQGRYVIPAATRPDDRLLCALCGLLCLTIGPVVVAGVTPWKVAVPAAVIAAVATGWHRRDRLSLRLVPWSLTILTVGLFLFVSAAGRHGLDDLLRHAVGSSGTIRAAGVAAGASNVTNNLPTYLALERAVPAGHQEQLLGVLVGVNVGPLVLLWGSLATLLWRERCRSRGVRISATRFALTGLAGMPLVLLAAAACLRWK
jgi:arsenical pump membrane protein